MFFKKSHRHTLKLKCINAHAYRHTYFRRCRLKIQTHHQNSFDQNLCLGIGIKKKKSLTIFSFSKLEMKVELVTVLFLAYKNINTIPLQLSGWQYHLTLPVLHTLSQSDFRKSPLSCYFPGVVAIPVTAQILDFLVWATETCTHGAYVTITFHSFLSRRISKVIPSHQLGTCCSPVPMVTRRGGGE